MEHTSGDDLARMQVAEDRLLEVAKSDLSDHFHRCETLAALREYFGLKGLSAESLRRVGVQVAPPTSGWWFASVRVHILRQAAHRNDHSSDGKLASFRAKSAAL